LWFLGWFISFVYLLLILLYWFCNLLRHWRALSYFLTSVAYFLGAPRCAVRKESNDPDEWPRRAQCLAAAARARSGAVTWAPVATP
ncbi:hypothetical protein, partial [Nocardia otitidiscaviarum]|uniref:hypothetical protein n=1 Tax=Nocardia otitidiscaviarum TaxID=1823 RepID=UPI002456FC03